MKVIEYWIHDKESFYKLNADEWRVAMNIVNDCNQGMNPEIELVERVEGHWGEDYLEGNYLIGYEYKSLYEKQKPT